MIIFEQAIKRIFKNKIKLLTLLIIPLLFILMFAMQSSRTLTIGIVDKDQSMLSKKLTNSLKEMNMVKVSEFKEKEVFDKTVSYQTDYSVIIESGFEEAILTGKSPDVKEFYINEKEKLFYARINVENFINNMKLLANGAGFDRTRFANALKEYEMGSLSLSNESDINEELPQSRAAMGFLVQFMLYMSIITAGIILEDKSSGVLYRAFYAPVTLRRYLAENLAAFLIIGVLQVTVIFFLIRYVLGLDLGNSPLSMYALYLVFSLVCISLGMWLVSLSKKPIYAYMTITLITTPLVMLGGCYWPMDFMPDIMQKIAKFLPTSWVMQGVEKLLFENKSITGLALEIMMLLIFSGIFMAAGLLRKVDISK